MDAYSFGQKMAASSPAWQRSEGKNDEGGLNEKGRKSYEREHGGDLKAPVTESNPSGERAKRRSSFCSRMCGMKRVNTGSKTKSDPDSRINKSLRKWNCKCSSAAQFGVKLAEETELPLATQAALLALIGGGAGLRHGALTGLTGGGLYGAINPGEYVDEQGQKQKRTILQGAAHHGFTNAGKLGLVGAGLGATAFGSFPLIAEAIGNKTAGLGTALAKGTAREVDRYNQNVQSENFENRDNADYQPQQEVGDSEGALLALLLGGGGLALANGPKLMQMVTGRGKTKRASAKDIFDIVSLS